MEERRKTHPNKLPQKDRKTIAGDGKGEKKNLNYPESSLYHTYR